METVNDVLTKRFSGSLVHMMKVIDPNRQFRIDETLGKAWDALPLVEQRRLYLYLLYRKWRGERFYGTPYEIVKNCHPYPTNWNGLAMINRLMKENQMVSARHNGEYGIYTLDEARLWEMSEVKPLNFESGE